MGYKTILVHCDADPKVVHRLAVAAELAKRHNATLIGLHIQPPLVVPALFDGTLAKAKAAFEKAVEGKGIAVEWRTGEGQPDQRLAVHARCADLTVVGQADADGSSSAPLDLPEDLALSAGRPVLVIPHIGAPAQAPRTILLCWNDSREAARAAADALPLMHAASKVVVLCIDPPSDRSGDDAAAWLSRHGIAATVQREPATDTDVGSVILSRASDLGADLIVMGLYGHSRLRETVLGGASRTLLASMTVPVLMAH